MSEFKNEISVFFTLCKKETLHYFNTLSAYIVTAVFLIIAGYLFTVPVFLRGNADIEGFLDNAPLLLVFFCSAAGMRVLAEEMKNSTIELLGSLPVKDWQIVLSKAVAAVSVITVCLALTLVYPVSVSFLGDIDFSLIGVSYLGLLLNAVLFVCISVAASSLTKNQIVGFIVSFGVCFFIYLIGKMQGYMPPWLASAAVFFSSDAHLMNFYSGIIDLRDAAYFLTFSFFFLYCAHVRLVSLRFK